MGSALVWVQRVPGLGEGLGQEVKAAVKGESELSPTAAAEIGSITRTKEPCAACPFSQTMGFPSKFCFLLKYNLYVMKGTDHKKTQ